jgi:hypothetical protein
MTLNIMDIYRLVDRITWIGVFQEQWTGETLHVELLILSLPSFRLGHQPTTGDRSRMYGCG